MNAIRERHTQVVKDLVKKPNVILNEMTVGKCAILHPVLGIVGEVFELFKAIRNSDRENIVEEIGDLKFYITDLRIVMSLDLHGESSYALAEDDNNLDEALRILEETTEKLHDKTKKYIIGNILIDSSDVFEILEVLETCLSFIMKEENIHEDEPINDNIKKLSTGKDGKKARYAEGYSDEAMQARVDKED